MANIKEGKVMQSNIRKIYELLHSPILTPYNLLENVKLDNYNYVNYYKGEIGIICEMECFENNNTVVKFYYHFDNNDHLYKVLMDSKNNKQEELFHRDSELKKELNKYSTHKNQKISNAK